MDADWYHLNEAFVYSSTVFYYTCWPVHIFHMASLQMWHMLWEYRIKSIIRPVFPFVIVPLVFARFGPTAYARC